MPLSASGARGIRLWDVIRPNQGGDTTESGPRCNRVWDVKRLRLLPRSLTSRESVFLLEHRSDGTDSFDASYIGRGKYSQHDLYVEIMGDVR